ncbi:MAG: hypothetical protein FLDDKLPJ_03357 [Phycisphaerae bacterium]|nr:hypothetical protein [Phycisphaerae bacterium]
MSRPTTESCDQVRRAWHAGLDEGRPDPDIAAHMRSCASCRDYAAEMTALLRLFEDARTQTRDMCLPIRGRERRSRMRAAPWRGGALRWAAAAALLVSGGYAGWRTGWFGDGGSHSGDIVQHPQGVPGPGEVGGPVNAPVLADADSRAPLPQFRLRPATEVIPVGKDTDRCIVVAADLPDHPKVKLYWVYDRVLPEAPSSTQGSG